MSRVWAVATHTVREALRMKIVLAFVCLIVVLVIMLPIAVRRPDATVSSTVQAFLSWSLRPTAVLLSFLAIFLGCLSISDEMEKRQIFTLVSKPLPRWQYVLGKWLGCVVVLSGLLMFAGLMTWLMAHYLASTSNPDALDANKLENEVLVARASVSLDVPDFTADARTYYEQMVDEGRVPEDRSRKEKLIDIAKLAGGMQQRWRSVAPGQQREFQFKGIMRQFLDDDDYLQLRYKAKGMGYAVDETLQTLWMFGDYTTAKQTGWIQRKDVMDRYHTIPFKASAVAPDGTLTVVVWNVDQRERYPGYKGATIAFEDQEGFEVFYQIGTFGGNLLRTLALVWCRVVLIAAVAVCCATLVSYPVACLMTFVFYVLAVSGDFVKEALSFGKTGDGVLGPVQYVAEPILDALFWLWPQFKAYDGLENFVDGRNVSLIWDITAFSKLVLLLATLFLMAACIIFRRRQVAELSV